MLQETTADQKDQRIKDLYAQGYPTVVQINGKKIIINWSSYHDKFSFLECFNRSEIESTDLIKESFIKGFVNYKYTLSEDIEKDKANMDIFFKSKGKANFRLVRINFPEFTSNFRFITFQMVDLNQMIVNEKPETLFELGNRYHPYWVEEPTNIEDVLRMIELKKVK